MERTGNEFFTGATLAMNENSRVCTSHFFDDFQHLHNLRTFSDYLFITMDEFIPVALCCGAVVFERFVHFLLDMFRLERLFQKIVRPEFCSLNRSLD